MNYRIEYLPIFHDDLKSAYNYIKNVLKNPVAADRIVKNTWKAIRKRAEYP